MKSIRRRMTAFVVMVVLTSLLAADPSFALTKISADPNGHWQKVGTSWFWVNPNGSNACYTNALLDGNKDGIAEYYMFDARGVLVTACTTTGGNVINSNGQLMVNGQVFTSPALPMSGFVSNDQLAKAVIALTNAERQKAGVGVLTEDAALDAAAQQRASECMVLFSHTRPDGSVWYDAFSKSLLRRELLAENLGRGYYTAESVVAAWMASEAHRANLLEPKLKKIGLACYYTMDTIYYVQEFSS